MAGYSVKINNCTKELSARDRVAIKDFTNATALDEATKEGAIIINVDFVAELDVHNEKAQDKDYKKFILVDKAGNKFVTGSTSFMTSLQEIMDEMADSGEEYQIEAYRVPSKNYKGKEFLTCSIV